MNYRNQYLKLACALLSISALSGCGKDKAQSGSNVLLPLSESVQCTPGTRDVPAPFVGPSECLKVGVDVIDDAGSVYYINQLYSDGRAEASYRSYNGGKVLSPGTYYPEVYKINGYLPTSYSSSVIDQSRNRYFVKRVFSNGKVELEFKQYDGRKFLDIRTLATSIPAFGNIRVNSRIIDGSNHRYYVKEIYSDGSIYAEYVDYDGRKFLSASEVSVAL